MAGSFFDRLSTKEKQCLGEKIDALIDLTNEWAPRYPSIRTVRIPPVALHAAITGPRMSLTDSLLTVKLSLWMFGIDDVADERMVSLAELRQKVERWCLIASDGSSREVNDKDDLSTMLLEIRGELSKFPLFEPLRERWVSEIRRFTETMGRQYRYGLQYAAGGSRALPSLDEYLDWGSRSIGVPFWAVTVWIVANDPSVQKYFEPINEATLYAGAAVRLYNDLKTLDREMRELNINSVVITYHALLNQNPDATQEGILSRAKRHVLQLADSYGQKCYGLVKQIQTDSGQAEEAISRTVAFHDYFYGRSQHEYNTTSLDEIHKLLGYSSF